ncbi:unnamed protein product [Rangifer tarandus platyrhynchus]|uniref:Uncharacterized protein n=2 Tax=Rangifer tarandus platyrhynchus TaxID=3082113 RepID=A0ACB0ERV8_RANTA|nr:unnamed protein product [Rangifer tarandus platyrhynchus]CAI9703092.1 unnamed protein product [Rangifer tarandus platyrhynchus]
MRHGPAQRTRARTCQRGGPARGGLWAAPGGKVLAAARRLSSPPPRAARHRESPQPAAATARRPSPPPLPRTSLQTPGGSPRSERRLGSQAGVRKRHASAPGLPSVPTHGHITALTLLCTVWDNRAGLPTA